MEQITETVESDRAVISSIFRKAAIEHTQNTSGSPIRQLGLASWILTAFFFLILFTTLTFLATVKYARRETVAGQVMPVAGSFRIVPQLNGTAANVYVREGQYVAAGAAIAMIAANQTLRNGTPLEDTLEQIQNSQRVAQAQQAAARVTQINQQIRELRTRRTGLERDIAKLDDLKELLARRMSLHKQTVKANADLAEKGMVSAAALRQQEDNLLMLEQQYGQAERDKVQQQALVAQIAPQMDRLAAEMQQTTSEDISARETLREKELNTVSHLSTRLLAPIAGYVTALKAREGMVVSAEETLAIIVPAAAPTAKVALEAELWAPSRAIGFVKPGDKVKLMYDSFPYETFGMGIGTVVEVSGSAIQPKEIPAGIEAKEQLFRIRVQLAQSKLTAFGKDWALSPSMSLKADLILEEQSLLQLMFEPLRATNNRFLN